MAASSSFPPELSLIKRFNIVVRRDSGVLASFSSSSIPIGLTNLKNWLWLSPIRYIKSFSSRLYIVRICNNLSVSSPGSPDSFNFWSISSNFVLTSVNFSCKRVARRSCSSSHRAVSILSRSLSCLSAINPRRTPSSFRTFRIVIG